MAKRYITATVEGSTKEQVRAALSVLVGPVLEQWEKAHFLELHIDICDVSDAIKYGEGFEVTQFKTSFPVVDIDVFARSDLDLRDLQVVLSFIIARGISIALDRPVAVRESGVEQPLAVFEHGVKVSGP